MGILDDAIRQHLDLKRRQGADAGELARLEDEAFGPPARPGDPDFPESAEQPIAGRDGDAASEVDQEAPPETGDASAATPPATAEEVRAPADEPAAAEAKPADSAEEGEPLFDAEGADGLDLDLELEIEDEVEELSDLEIGSQGAEAEAAPPATAEQPIEGEVEAPPAGEEPIEALDTVEHHFEGALDEAEVVEEREAEPAAEPAESAEPDAEAEHEPDEEEDVLEETPEFLRDQPEDDELWFEQGEPKDFDF